MGLVNDQTQKYSITSNGGGGSVFEFDRKKQTQQKFLHLDKIRLKKRSKDDDDDRDDTLTVPPTMAVSPYTSLYTQLHTLSSIPKGFNVCNPAPGIMSTSNGQEMSHHYPPHMTYPPPPFSLRMPQFQSIPAMNIHQMEVKLPSNQSLYKHQEQDKMMVGKKRKKRALHVTLDNVHSPSQPSPASYDSRKQLQVARESSLASRSNFLNLVASSSSVPAANHPFPEIPHLQHLPCEQEDLEPCRWKRRQLPFYNFFPSNKEVTDPSTLNERSKSKSGSKEETEKNIDLTLKL